MARAAMVGSATQTKLVSGFEQHRKSPFKSSLKFYFMGAVIVCAAAFIVFSAMQGASVYYYDVHEVQSKLVSGTLGSDPFRMAGQVIPGTIVTQGDVHTFKVSDMKQKDVVMTVSFKGAVPDTFKDEAQVTVTGKYDGAQKMFVASELLAKCPSKYSSTAS